MHSLTAAVLLVAFAYTSASAIIAGHGVSRGALEGALGGQWIPDVPAGHAGVGIVGAPALGLGLGLGAGWGAGALGWGAGALGLGAGAGAIGAWGGHGPSARGALEGALGGQWIPDVPVHGH